MNIIRFDYYCVKFSGGSIILDVKGKPAKKKRKNEKGRRTLRYITPASYILAAQYGYSIFCTFSILTIFTDNSLSLHWKPSSFFFLWEEETGRVSQNSISDILENVLVVFIKKRLWKLHAAVRRFLSHGSLSHRLLLHLRVSHVEFDDQFISNFWFWSGKRDRFCVFFFSKNIRILINDRDFNLV